MGRFTRVVAVDVPHHVTQRGNGRRFVLDGEADRTIYRSEDHAKRSSQIEGKANSPSTRSRLSFSQVPLPEFVGKNNL
jgi:hypothetical protein